MIIFISCRERQQNSRFEYKSTIVNAKTIIVVEGSTQFILSFQDGGSEICSFGQYNQYQVGDSICLVRDDRSLFYTWYIIKCGKLIN